MAVSCPEHAPPRTLAHNQDSPVGFDREPRGSPPTTRMAEAAQSPSVAWRGVTRRGVAAWRDGQARLVGQHVRRLLRAGVGRDLLVDGDCDGAAHPTIPRRSRVVRAARAVNGMMHAAAPAPRRVRGAALPMSGRRAGSAAETTTRTHDARRAQCHCATGRRAAQSAALLMPMFALKYWREHVAVTVPTDGNLGECPHDSNRIILREMEVSVAAARPHARGPSAGPAPCIAVPVPATRCTGRR